MTSHQQIIAHCVSLLLMILTISGMYWLSYDFAHYTMFLLGCGAFGVIWQRVTNLLIYQND
jgi:hypothetical protein